MDRKEKDPLHAPDEPTGDRLPVEPEMQKGEEPDNEAPKENGARPVS